MTASPHPHPLISTGTVRLERKGQGEWTWYLATRAGITVAQGVRSYTRRGDARRAANAALNAARAPRVVEPARSRVAS
jgi:hypothetical protein